MDMDEVCSHRNLCKTKPVHEPYKNYIQAKPLSLNIEIDVMRSIDMFVNKRIHLPRTIRISSENGGKNGKVFIKFIHHFICIQYTEKRQLNKTQELATT